VFPWRLELTAGRYLDLSHARVWTDDITPEGLSRMAEKGLTIGELAEQSGHRTAQVLLRYVNARVPEASRTLG